MAHDLLLDEKRLKHLRVTTDRDFVPVGVPLISPGLRQTGLNMHLGPRPGCIGLFGLFSFQPVIGTWLCWLRSQVLLTTQDKHQQHQRYPEGQHLD